MDKPPNSPFIPQAVPPTISLLKDEVKIDIFELSSVMPPVQVEEAA
jgi:hypothetical protein